MTTRKRKRPPKRERELALLQRAERSLTHLRTYHARPLQTWDWLVPVIARLTSERVILEQAITGDPDARMLRQSGGRDAADTVGQ